MLGGGGVTESTLMDAGAAAVGGIPGQPDNSSALPNTSLNVALCGLLGVVDGGVAVAARATPKSSVAVAVDP